MVVVRRDHREALRGVQVDVRPDTVDLCCGEGIARVGQATATEIENVVIGQAARIGPDRGHGREIFRLIR